MYGSKHRTTDGLYETRKDGSGYSSTKREWNSQTHEFTDETSNHRKYIRTQSSTNNRTVPSSLSSQQQRQSSDKDKKTVKDSKKPLRVFGDWSEFKSSTGKTYFYNSKTEISQWEKPKGWPTDDTSSSNARSSSTSISTDRTKKESSNSSVTSTVRSRYKMEESSYHSRHQQRDVQLVKHHQNGDIHSHLSNHNKQESSHSDETTTNLRLPSPSDDSSRMSFSSTNSKESSVATTSDRNSNVLQTSLSVPAVSVLISTSDKPLEKDFISSNGSDIKTPTSRSVIPPITKLDQSSENEPLTPSISKAERDQEIQKYYRNNFIQHLTNWPSTQLEKQCLRLFDEYYSCSAKMSTAFVELKALKSNFRVLEIKRSIVTQRLLRCQQHNKERADDKLL